jgi:ABC-2 type transport system ATP-binding protein
MMVGLLTPTSGTVLMDGEIVKPGSLVVKEKVGMCPQDIVIWERLSCIENLQVIGDMYDMPRRVLKERINQLLHDLQLWDKRNTLAAKLSGGMKRRLNLAMALVHDPEIVVLDEPSPGLDPQTRLMLWEYIQALPENGKKTVILTTHMMEEADRLCDRVAIIDHGKLLVLDTPENLKRTIGEGDVIELTVAGVPARCKSAIKLLSTNLQISNAIYRSGKIEIRARDALKLMPDIFRTLIHANCNVIDVKLRKNTLEDVFVSLTGRSLRE